MAIKGSLSGPVVGIVGPVPQSENTGSPGGNNGQIQYNSAGNFGGITAWTSNGLTALTGASGSTLAINGATIGAYSLASLGDTYLGGNLQVAGVLPIPAGGTAGLGISLTSTTNFGVYIGSGVPTLSAAQGSLYLRSDGGPYYNNNGTTGWVPVASIGPLIANTTTTSGFTTGQILYSDGSKLQAAGNVIATSLALGGATVGTNALAVTGTSIFSAGVIISGTTVVPILNASSSVNAAYQTAIAVGGSSSLGLFVSSTANFGIMFGSGSPTISAAQGSIYLRSDGPPSYNNNGSTGWTALQAAGNYISSLTGDVTATGPGAVAATLATVNSNVGTFGSATQAPQFTVNGKGLITAASNVTITPAIGSVTGLGTGVATALAINVGSAGAFVTFNGVLGAPSSGTATNLTGLPLSTGVTGQLPLANGGTAANLTASNGGIFYSTASAGAILGGTATANQVLVSGASSAPSWTTATFPSTAAAGTVLAAASSNVISATATPTLGANSGTGGQITFNGSTSGSVALRVAASAGTSTVFQLPATNGTNTYVLQTDGTGVTSWAPSAGGGTVTTVSVVSANGFAGTVANATTTPAITLTTSITGTLQGNGTAISASKVTLTQPATGSTLTILDGKTLTSNNTLTLAGTDSTTMTFPGTSSTVLTTGNTATLTVGFTFTANNIGTVSSGTTTPAPASGNYQYLTNNGAFTLAAPSSDCAIDVLVTNGASAGAITFSGFTVGSSTGSALTTTNTSKFIVSIRRINSVSTYSIYALQ